MSHAAFSGFRASGCGVLRSQSHEREAAAWDATSRKNPDCWGLGFRVQGFRV